jgi:hypothetical protein
LPALRLLRLRLRCRLRGRAGSARAPILYSPVDPLTETTTAPSRRQSHAQFGALLLLLVGAACGGSDGDARGGRSLPECAPDEPEVDLPARFPRAFPFPPGTVITVTGDVRAGAAKFTIIQGILPGRLTQAQTFFSRELPASGFRLGAGDSEAHEAETDFRGHGIRGRLKVNDILECPGVMTLEIAFTRP